MKKQSSHVRCCAGILILSSALLQAGCQPDSHADDNTGRLVRNVIVMIGDGMSLPEIAFLVQYRKHVHPEQPETSFERLLRSPDHGLADTYAVYPDGRETLTVDSSASATQIACGVMSLPQATGVDREGYPCETALERAKALGMATGLVTDTRVTHATPSAFVAKQISRSAENEIAAEYITGDAAGKVDVLFGGGARYFLPASMRVNQVPECAALPSDLVTAGARADDRNLIDEARLAGYQFVCDERQLLEVPEAPGAKVLGTFAGGSYPPYPERATVPGLPSLETVARKTIQILDRAPGGFFAMIEAGEIDEGGHKHDGAYLLRAMQEADRVLGFLLDYADSHPGTLLVVLGDHETGTPVFSYTPAPPVSTTLPSGQVYTRTSNFGDPVAAYTLLEHQTLSLGGMMSPILGKLYRPGYQPNPDYPLERGVADLVSTVEASSDFTITPDQARRVLAVAPGTTVVPVDGVTDPFFQSDPMANRLSRALAEQTRLLFATGEHTSLPVVVMAAGPGALTEQVRGYNHTTDVAKLLFRALGR